MNMMDVFANIFRDNSSLLLAVMVFLAAGTFAFSLMAFARVRGSVKRRAARINDDPQSGGNSRRSLRYSSLKAVTQLIEYTTKHYTGADEENLKVLRERLVQAGIYDPRGVAYFFIGRTALAVGLAGAALLYHADARRLQRDRALADGDRRRHGRLCRPEHLHRPARRRPQIEHRLGFPDFMDLLVVCADSGLSMEASLERVGREIGDGYPSLAANIHMTNLEIRAGRPLKDALERFATRLALEEARAFSTLINQSIDLGSSITDALRVYSDDMRHKRLSLAEEKAYALPAKLAVPMMVCIFPVLFIVILLPVFVRLHVGHYI